MTGSDAGTAQDEWEAHNESFQYEPPQKPPEAWPSEEYTKLFDRVIDRRVTWVCQKCSKPHNSLQKARRHVESKHSDTLIDQARLKIEGADDAE